MKDLKSIFSEENNSLIIAAVKEAELNTSGEIRLHVEDHCKIDVLDQAAFIFKSLEMHKTELRNGVLFYLALKDRKFAILGDAGINAKVPENFWEDIKQKMSDHFKKEEFILGLTEGIKMAGEQLKKHFPHQKNDVNELSDTISFGEDK